MLTEQGSEIFCFVSSSHVLVVLLPENFQLYSAFKVAVEVLNWTTGTSTYYIFSIIWTT